MLLNKQYAAYDDLSKAFAVWKTPVPAILEATLYELIEDISACLHECCNTSQYEENEFGISTVMNTINVFKKHNTPYGIMTLRILFENPYILNQVKASPLGNYIQNMLHNFSRTGIENYAIDIKMLSRLFPDM